MMPFKINFLAAALVVSAPAAALAQNVVPPPTPPGGQASASAPAPSVAPPVAPPVSVTSANPAAAVKPAAAPQLIDIALPDAPKPDKVDLKPAAPAAAGAKAPAKKPSAKREDVAEKAAAPLKPLDPFAGLVGTPVSDSQLNRFVFPEAVEGVFFPEGTPLPDCPNNAAPMDPCKPIFLNGKRVMLLQLRAGAKGPIQMMTQLSSGRFIDMNLTPVAGPAAVIRIDGAEDGASDARLAAGRKSATAVADAGAGSPSEQYVSMLSKFATGSIPEGFESIKVGATVRFEHFDVIPMASWDNGANLRAHLMQVKAHGKTPVVINAALFRNENVRALALDRETITNSAPAQLFMLEFVPTEGQ